MLKRGLKMATIRWAFNHGLWHPSREEWMLAAQLIQEEEKARIGRFMFQRDAKAAMTGRLLLRKVISYTLGIPYKDVILGRTEKGKPYLENKGYGPLTFNISHQGDYSVLAADVNYNVGIDVMKIEYPKGAKSVNEFFRHMYRQFTDQEWAKICESDNEWEQLAAFYRNWCLKESYVKAIGTGIGFTLQRADFFTRSPVSRNSITTDTSLLIDNVIQEDFLFQETMLDDKHCVAVALQKEKGNKLLPNIPQFYELSFEELVDEAQALLPPDESYWLCFSTKQLKP